MPDISERLEDLDGQPVFWREAPSDGTPIVYLHGVPVNSDDWVPFLSLIGGLAPDLPGFGRSGKRGDGDYTLEGYDRWLERFLDWRGVDRLRLVVHDWGGFGLAFAQRFPERIERLVVFNTVPLLPGFRWHAIARIWRTRVLGELSMGLTNPLTARAQLRLTKGTVGRPSDRFIKSILDHLDQGTQRAILKLYRSSPPEKLAAAGANLAAITCPALIVWGARDTYAPVRFADGYKAALGDAELIRLEDASHWPWMDRPDVIETVAAFLDG